MAPRQSQARLSTTSPPAPAHNATASRPAQAQVSATMATRLAQAQAQVQASNSFTPAQTQNTTTSEPAQAHTQTTNMPPTPRRPTAEELSFGPPPTSSPIQTYIFPGQPTTRLGQPIDLPGPRTNPLAAITTLVAAGISVPGEAVNAGNLAQQTLTNELDNQARTAAAAARGEITYMDNGRYGMELRRIQEQAEQRARERFVKGEISREEAEREGRVRGWDLGGWKVGGEGKGVGRREE